MSTWAQTNNAYFQDGGIVGSTNEISVTRLPVLANGSTYYWDLTIPFQVDAAGDVIIGSMTQVKSPGLIVSNFRPGTYVAPPTVLNGQGIIVVTGPGIWNGKYTEWTISTGNGANDCTYPATGTFYVSPLSVNPIYTRLKAANISSTAWSYGVGDGSCYSTWPSNGIIGVSQVENTLTIASFTTSNFGTVTDFSTPVDTITYTLKAQ